MTTGEKFYRQKYPKQVLSFFKNEEEKTQYKKDIKEIYTKFSKENNICEIKELQAEIEFNLKQIEKMKIKQSVIRSCTLLTAGLCDNCKVPKMINTGGDGVHEPSYEELYCKKKEMVIEPQPLEDQIKECDGFEPCS